MYVISLNMSMTDQDDVCKAGSVWCALSPVPWSQLRSEMREHFIGRCCQPPSGFSFFRVSCRKQTHFLTNYYESEYLSSLANKVTEKLLRYSTCWKCRWNFSRGHFPTCSYFLHLVLQLFSASITGHFHVYLFQPNLPSSFLCSLIL